MSSIPQPDSGGRKEAPTGTMDILLPATRTIIDEAEVSLLISQCILELAASLRVHHAYTACRAVDLAKEYASTVGVLADTVASRAHAECIARAAFRIACKMCEYDSPSVRRCSSHWRFGTPYSDKSFLIIETAIVQTTVGNSMVGRCTFTSIFDHVTVVGGYLVSQGVMDMVAVERANALCLYTMYGGAPPRLRTSHFLASHQAGIILLLSLVDQAVLPDSFDPKSGSGSGSGSASVAHLFDKWNRAVLELRPPFCVSCTVRELLASLECDVFLMRGDIDCSNARIRNALCLGVDPSLMWTSKALQRAYNIARTQARAYCSRGNPSDKRTSTRPRTRRSTSKRTAKQEFIGDICDTLTSQWE